MMNGCSGEGPTLLPATDIGASFSFRAVFDLDPDHTIAIDGPVVVTTRP